jgi:adenylosuccinate synthase
MKRATAVIGAAFGDEGKGLLTDYFCRQAGEEPTVVRFCGGANAGHTVVTPEGDRHVFHHFGAGTLAGARTYLSRYFLVNPVLWREEYEVLQGRGLRTRLFVDREAPLTTVYDMMANQLSELERGDKRHGSCGAGVHATMFRNENAAFRLVAGDLERPAFLRQRVNRIRDMMLGDQRGGEDILERFLMDCERMRAQINLCDSRVISDRGAEVIFEGSQGLLLDQDNKWFFPHVTHAKTGLWNVLQIANEADINQIDAVYVTRPYLTRHGAGELPGEDPELHYFDNTNEPNRWQGALRFAPMNTDLIEMAIGTDLMPARGWSGNVTPVLAVTHMDQLPTVPDIACPAHYVSHGPTCRDVYHTTRR